MHYCSTQCQQTDWTLHKHECKPLAALVSNQPTVGIAGLKKSLENDQTRLFLRILIKLKEKESTQTDDAGLKTFESLMDR